MGAGKYRHRVRVQAPVETIINGSPKYSWSDLGTFWAGIKAIRSKEPTEIKAIVDLTVYEITLRYLDITSKHRIIYDGKVFHLAEVVHDERKTETICNAVVRAGELPTANFVMTASGGISIGGQYE